MEIHPPIQSTQTQLVEKAIWKESKKDDGYHFECPQGELLMGSVIWMDNQNESDKHRHCSIVLRGDINYIKTNLDSPMYRTIDDTRPRPKNGNQGIYS
jgi:hypothetical protein